MNHIKLRTYIKAKEEVDSLQCYINLIDDYEVNSLEEFIIKFYAISNSTSGVIKEFNKNKPMFGTSNLKRDYIITVIKSPPIDELHKIIRQGYIRRYGK